jgi:hypothetical protein
LKELETSNAKSICWKKFRQTILKEEEQNWTNRFYEKAEGFCYGGFFVLLGILFFKTAKYSSSQ